MTDRDPAQRVEDFIAQASTVAPRLARPLKPIGLAGAGVGLVVWLLLAAPFWDDALPVSSGLVLLVVLLAPGLWLVVHRWWLDRAFRRAGEVAPGTRELGQGLYGRATSMTSGGLAGAHEPDRPRPRGALKQAWRFYREDVRPVRRQATGVFENVLAVIRPLLPPFLVATGVSLVLVVVLALLIPIAIAIRVVLIAT